MRMILIQNNTRQLPHQKNGEMKLRKRKKMTGKEGKKEGKKRKKERKEKKNPVTLQ